MTSGNTCDLTMIFLLDTHALIWYQEDNPLLPPEILTSIKSLENRVLFSQVSLMEIAIKQKIGKLPDFKASVEMIHEQALDDGFEFLPIHNRHIANYRRVPLFDQHRDPFDRLLIGTAEVEGAIILTADGNFSLYADFVSVLW
jgi:PIN domain nuclease of toxin-antitoxin system